MKRKIGTILDEELITKLKIKAVQKRMPLAEVLQEAVNFYLRADPSGEDRRRAMTRVIDPPLKLTPKQLRQIMEEDYYDQ